MIERYRTKAITVSSLAQPQYSRKPEGLSEVRSAQAALKFRVNEGIMDFEDANREADILEAYEEIFKRENIKI